MMRIRSCLILALGALLLPARGAEVSLENLRPHPRLLLTAEGQVKLERMAKENELLAAMLVKLREAAEFAITVPPATYKLVGPGPRRQLLLHESQAALSRVMVTGLAYRLFHDDRYAQRALAELRAVVAFADWHPSHFLDAGEMAAVVAVGYDWLYPLLSDAERREFRAAIIQKALEPSQRFYNPPGRGWALAKNNWNQVCNGGLTLGALAIAGEEPEIAKKYLSLAIDSAPRGMAAYAPDGAYPEGPMYWTYGTVFNCLMLSGLDTALGHDFGLSKASGFSETGLYMAHMIGPHDAFFNYADCHSDDGAGRSSAPMYWLAGKFNRPLYSWFRSQELKETIATLDITNLKRSNKYFPLDIVWFTDLKPADASLPLTAFFRGTEAVTMRSSFTDDRATYVGFKAGDNRANHSHLDLGSFVLDAQGVRWGVDLGSDDYDMEGYWDVKGGQRWSFYRLNTQSHNTLTIGGANQDPHASTTIVKYSPDAPHAVADLSAAYAGNASRVERGIALVDDTKVLIQDEIGGVAVGDPIRWAMVTTADIVLDGARATLRKGNEQLVAEIIQPKNASWEIISTRPPTEQEMKNKGTRMLAFTVPGEPAKDITLRVLMSPGKRGGPAPELRPLANWETIEIAR